MDYKITPISRERIDEVEEKLQKLHEDLKGIPHIILITASDAADNNKVWAHQQINVSGNESMSMFVELLKNNPEIAFVIERALEWHKITMKHGEKPSISTMIQEAMKNTLKDMGDIGDMPKGLKEFLNNLGNDLKSSEKPKGSSDDVDDLLRNVFNKDDEEGDKQD